MNVIDLARAKTTLKRVGNTHGGEFQGPCPACWGKDRFHVWPMENDGDGAYWCRQCEKSGDNIQFLIDFDGATFPEACKSLGKEDKLNEGDRGSEKIRPRYMTPQSPAAKAAREPEWKPEICTTPAEVDAETWREKAANFVEWAYDELMKLKPFPQWLIDRGIDEYSAKQFRLGWNPGDNGKDLFRPRQVWGLPKEEKENGKQKALWLPVGLVIPQLIDGQVQRIRFRTKSGRPPYYVLPGSSMACMVCQGSQRAFVVIESELDAIMLDHTITDLAGIVALGNSSRRPDAHTHVLLKSAAKILMALDDDDPGAKAAAWWFDTYPQAADHPIFKGKDPGEAYEIGFKAGDGQSAMEGLRAWVVEGLPPAWFPGKPGDESP